MSLLDVKVLERGKSIYPGRSVRIWWTAVTRS